MAIKLTENTKEPRVYEVSFLLSPYIDEEKMRGKVEEIRKVIKDNKGLSIDEGEPSFITLAYTIELVSNNKRSQYDSAYFGWVKFELEPKSVDTVKQAVDSMDEVLRSLVLATVRENTQATERVLGKEADVNESSSREEEVTEELHKASPAPQDTEEETSSQKEINEEELDQKIDELASTSERSESNGDSEQADAAAEEGSEKSSY